ncbi:hypothetical protein AB0H58_10880 [Nocardia neocaledoniensis]|uniref:Uncharacterized protein n=1 Tax=Nocardia neocaledoniensis TaxID=236511 RepID=A0A317P2T3_9NOCA|nr:MULTISPECIES: hypothetical protein [Nocardia]PWV81362.1 hypothetical protein DFR69_101702 [Nocardia neocaledoniensis]UGT56873.1 hypothetical protein LTT85_08510 [Nocardia asteroides]GEM34899.1 hypothetical protein NN3_59060 [Nocardia neocaledoniensis NBRC 108232]
MAIEVVSASMMTSDATAHIARCVGGDLWVVSWLPGRTLTGAQALAAMTIASTTSHHEDSPDAEWQRIETLARELGLTGREAVYLVNIENHELRRSMPPHVRHRE